ncbi:MAG: ABC transporter substrate-binding protein [Desulfopila sp.]
MTRRTSLTLLTYLFFLVLHVLQVAPATAGLVVDQTGAEVDVPSSPRRVLALAPSLTEMIFSLQAGDRLVGATSYSNYPEAARKLPRIGSYVKLDLEKIVALQPDLCIAIKDGNPLRSIEAIKALGIPVFAIDPHTIDQITEAFLFVGDLLGASEKAEELVGEMKQRIALVQQKVAASRIRPRVFFQISDMPIISAGKDSYIDKLITMAGGSNLAGSMPAYPRFSWENILQMQPDIVIISSMTGGKSATALKDAWLKWPEIPASKHHRLYVVDADLFNRPTERLIDGLEILSDILHPEYAGKPSAH